MVVCLHQFFRPERKMFIKEGVGDCTTCTHNEENKNCKMYSPININLQMEVSDLHAEVLE